MAKKKKKQLRQRINPEKSNKMIYAVGGGLAVVMALILFIMLRSGDLPDNPGEVMKSSLRYVEKTEGILDVQTNAETFEVTIVYEPADHVDIVQVAQYAGVRLSHRLEGQEVKIRLSRYRPENVEYIFWALDGRVERYEVVEGVSSERETESPGDPPAAEAK